MGAVKAIRKALARRAPWLRLQEREGALATREAAVRSREELHQVNEQLVLAMRKAQGLAEMAAEAAELGRRGSEARFRALVAATAAVVWRTDAAGQAVVDSPGYRAFTGQSEAEYRGAGWLAAVHPADRLRVRAAWSRAVSSGAIYECEHRLRLAGGGYARVAARAAPVPGVPGLAREWIGMIADITARRRDEEARERFIAILGHDLRGPLSAILLGAFYLLRSDALPGPLRAAVRGMTASAERMTRLIEDVLDLARGRLGGGLPVTRRPCDLGALLGEIAGELAMAYPERDLALSVEGDLAGRWDRDRLAQLVSNLLGNAISHGEDPIRVAAWGEGGDVVIEVANRGAPIPAALLPELFEPFRRGARGHGLGLGLFIVHEIARSHGGGVAVRSSAEAGTAFTVRLPREEGAPRAG